MADKLTLKDYLKLMSQMESSGNIQKNHPMATHGVNAGDKARGQYALMPNTAYEVLHPKDSKVIAEPSLSDYRDLSKEQLAVEIPKNPALEQSIAESYGQRVLNRARTPQEASQMWNQGPGMPLDLDKIQSYPRTQKFNRLLDALKSKDDEKSDQ